MCQFADAGQKDALFMVAPTNATFQPIKKDEIMKHDAADAVAFESFKAYATDPTRFRDTGASTEEVYFGGGWSKGRLCLITIRSHLKDIFKMLPKDGSIPFQVFYNLNDSMVRAGGQPFDLSELVNVYLKRFQPLRIILRQTDSVWEGCTEESFCMAWSKERANVWWSGKAFSMLGEHMLDATKDAEHNQKKLGGYVFDPTDPLCPVQINWPKWLAANNKFDARNALFTVKVHEVEEEDACLA